MTTTSQLQLFSIDINMDFTLRREEIGVIVKSYCDVVILSRHQNVRVRVIIHAITNDNRNPIISAASIHLIGRSHPDALCRKERCKLRFLESKPPLDSDIK